MGDDHDEPIWDEADDRPATVCPLCAVGCRLTTREEGRRATGRPGPANPNGRLCRKGIHAFERTAGEDRLTDPQVRRDGSLTAVSWDRAYDRIVEALVGIRQRHGPDGLAFLGAPHCTNEENYLLQKLARSLGTNNVDNRARHCHVSAARALEDRLGWPATTNSLDDLRETDVVLVVGANPAERQPIAFNSYVRPAVTDGATLVHVDPVGNETTRLAEEHVAPVPGTDGLVLDAVSAAIVEAGEVDRQFVSERTTGLDRFVASLEDTARRVTADAGVDEETVERVASLIGGADRTAAIVGTGVGETDDGRQAAHALLNLLLLTGNVGRRGTGVHVFRGPPNEQGSIDAGCVPDRLPGHRPVSDDQARARVAEEWGIDVPATPGRSASDLLATFGDDVRAAVVVGENPAVSKRDREWVRERLAALDALIVLEVSESATTAHADVVLPAAAGVEKTGTVTNLDRQLQRLFPVRQSPGRARPDLAILRDLGQRLPVETTFEYDSAAAVFAEFTRVAPTHEGIAYDDLETGSRRWPVADGSVLYRESFETADGLARFVVAPGSADPQRDGLHLVVGGRASEVDTDGTDAQRVVRIHPDDADRRQVADGDAVSVSDGDRTVRVRAAVDEGVRPGTVFLHAAVADPLVRAGASTVSVSARD